MVFSGLIVGGANYLSETRLDDSVTEPKADRETLPPEVGTRRNALVKFVRKAAEMVARLRIPVRGDGDNDVWLALLSGSRLWPAGE